jgi:outer membrane cobalamin receptor
MIEFNFGGWKTPTPSQPTPFSHIGFKSFNIGETEIKGIDFSSGFEGKFAGILWQGMLGYTYTIPVILDENYVFALDSLRGPQNFRNTSSDSLNILKYRFEHQIKIDLQASYKRFELGISWRYNSQIRNVDRAFIDGIIPFFVPGIQEARNELSGNNIVDFRASFKINKNLKIALIINNLLNSETMFRPADLGPPRMTMLQLSGRF